MIFQCDYVTTEGITTNLVIAASHIENQPSDEYPGQYRPVIVGKNLKTGEAVALLWHWIINITPAPLLAPLLQP